MEGDVWHVVVSPLRRWNTFKRGVGERMTPEPKTQENDEFTFPFTNITISKERLKALVIKGEFLIDEVWCPKCERFILIKDTHEDITELKGFANCADSLRRCPHCKGREFEIYYSEFPP